MDMPKATDRETETQENGTLYVPSMYVDAYKSAPVWRDFKNIVGI